MAAVMAWWLLRPADVLEGFAADNGRIRAMRVDIISRIAGRIDATLVKEGQFVREGEVLAKTGTRMSQEQRLKAITQTKETQSVVAVTWVLPEQRQSETCATQSLTNQRQVELNSVTKRHTCPRSLAQWGIVSVQQLDNDRVATGSARVALESAEAQVFAFKAAIEVARTNIIQAQTRTEAAQAAERRTAVDTDNSELKAPRDRRMQYWIAESDEVLAAGGRVLNMVDFGDVYMTSLLPTEQAGTPKLGGEVRLILDIAPDLRIPATISFVVSVAQSMLKTAEASNEQLKLMFRVKARTPPELLQQHLEHAKTGLLGVTWARVNEELPWSEDLVVRSP